MGNSSSSSNPDDDQKKSLYRRFKDSKQSKPLSDEDILKYTGKTRDELNTWAETQPGVAGNQLAGRAAMGPTTGLGGMAMADGYGGWGPSAEPNDENRGMKFPPSKEVPPVKEVEAAEVEKK
ncbi:hypothetical protein FSARC_6056 [Fusarium sarcochroum]|uniref:Uncharacterized protein n=1 Tax=Fusarium sarcochroum TaxID=1208366 RepID=A0A8H4X8W9_9HYPO|nr:hypothetical protein FSARC_6056 [Fusarium sarcochroum]